jgi:uncharacterized protein
MPFSLFLFQLIVIVGVPILSLLNAQMIEKLKVELVNQKVKLYFQSAINQMLLAILAIWAANSAKMPIVYFGNYNKTAIIIGALFLVTSLTVSYFSTKQKGENVNPAIDFFTPITIKEKAAWILVNIVASFCEEIIFRVVLFTLLLSTLHNPILAAVITTIVFGVSHSIQGVVGIVITAIFGLVLQYIVHLSNGILIATVVHFIHNIATTFLIIPISKKADNQPPLN